MRISWGLTPPHASFGRKEKIFTPSFAAADRFVPPKNLMRRFFSVSDDHELIFNNPEVQPPTAQRTRLIALGDCGDDYPQKPALASQMKQQAAETPTAGLVCLGDNVYQDDWPTLTSQEYYSLTEEVLLRPFAALSAQMPILPVEGNYEAQRTPNELEQLDFLGLPRYYKFKFANGLAEVFVIDTTLMEPLAGWSYHPREAKRIQAVAQEQSSWLEHSLRNSRARYKIVSAHHPIYSSGGFSGEYLKTPLRGFRERLEGVLSSHNVSLYLAAHHHHYERASDGERTYIVSGGGTSRSHFHHVHDRPPYQEDGVVRHAIKPASQHFVVLDVTPQALKIQAIDLNGNVLDTAEIQPAALSSPIDS